MESLKEKLYKTKIKFLERRITELEQKLEGNLTLEIDTQKKIDESKKQEIINSLDYLKSKEVRTKQDQISIYTLEVILKGMR